MVKKQAVLKIRSSCFGIGLQCVRNVAKCKIVRDGYTAIRRMPRNGTGAECLPAQ